MKIVRFGMQMQETLGLLDDQNKVRSLKGVFDLSNNESIGDQLIIEKLNNIDINSLPISIDIFMLVLKQQLLDLQNP